MVNEVADIAQYSQMFQDPVFQRAYQDVQKVIGLKKSYRGQQKQERLAPVTNALSGLGEQWKSAQTDEARQQANALANLTRSNFIAGGGSPSELPTNLWGGDTAQGFQASQGFQAPITGYEGLKREDAITAQRNALADLMEREKWQANPESQSWYLPLFKQKTEADISNTLRSANMPYGGSGGGSSSGTQTDRNNSNLADAFEAVDSAISNGVSLEAIRSNINNQAASLTRVGVDPTKVVTYLESKYPTQPTPEEQAKAQEAAETYRLNSRPGWQQTVDYWLPGKQYR